MAFLFVEKGKTEAQHMVRISCNTCGFEREVFLFARDIEEAEKGHLKKACLGTCAKEMEHTLVK